jgi:S-adenosylmethionine:tRNA ribosyltransferase-isomerase
MHPKNISIGDYTYPLPEQKIATHPLEIRDASRLLVYRNGEISESVYRHIADHIPQYDMLVFNNTKVIEARIIFKKASGAHIEIFCLAPSAEYAHITRGLQKRGKVRWQCLVGGASKWKAGQVLEKNISHEGKTFDLHAVYIEKISGAFIIELSWTDDSLSFAEVLHAAGAIPLPPYIKRAPEASDKERYQTVYAREEGSVAAPTAGLHFTASVMNDLREKNIRSEFLTLHVGAGTFKPVSALVMADHIMHEEYMDVSADTIRSLLSQPPFTITAVGTTSLRTLESLYWIGVKIINGDSENLALLNQWFPYEQDTMHIPTRESLQALIHFLEEKKWERLLTQTRLLIAPGYKFHVANKLVTNFHQPSSTLLLLVAALVGEDWKKIYTYALENNFRFLSYGDGCLLEGKN